MTVKAPYHFVPLSKWVLLPDWSHLVSHDVPFEDGLCGTIDYTLTNASPLLVGNEHESQDDGSTLIKWARDPDGRPIIPGSSVKGMIRSVMEIATFGKMNRVKDEHFSYRDISTSANNYFDHIDDTFIKAAWLRFDNGKWKIRFAEHIVVFDDEFNDYSSADIQNVTLDNSDKTIDVNQRKIIAKQSVVDKYKKYPLSNHAIGFSIEKREIKGTKGHMVKVSRAIQFNKNDECKNSGYPVFLGFRPGSANEYLINRLSYNYIFYNEIGSEKEIDIKLVNNFFDSNDIDTIDYLKNNPHPELGIPVFLRINSNNNKVKYIGLSKLPRIKFEHSLKSILNNQQVTQTSIASYDFAETLFGTIKNNGLSLKSRILFDDLNIEKYENRYISKTREVILSEPKSSYVNSYIEQPTASHSGALRQNDFDNYNKKSSRVSGWKRYPASNKSVEKRLPDYNGKLPNKNIMSILEKLKEDCRFKGKLHFHNLKPVELGALLWVLTFGNNNSNYHSLGHAKPLGFGLVQFDELKLKCIANNCSEINGLKEYLHIFEEYMEKEHIGKEAKDSWKNSTQIKHLLSFSDLNYNSENYDINKRLKYMNLEEYSNTKKARHKTVLSQWHCIERTEIEKMNIEFVDSYNIERINRGRLSNIIDNSEIDKTVCSIRTEEELNRKKPECLKKLEKIIRDLNSNSNIFSQNDNLSDYIDAAIEKGDFEISTIQSLLDLIRNVKECGFLKKPKTKSSKKIEKFNQKKSKLIELKNKYNIQN